MFLGISYAICRQAGGFPAARVHESDETSELDLLLA